MPNVPGARIAKLEPGEDLYSIATGKLNVFWKTSRDAVKFIADQTGFKGLHMVPDGRLVFMFDSLNDAKMAKNNAEAKGIVCGRNIMHWVVADDGVPECWEIAK